VTSVIGFGSHPAFHNAGLIGQIKKKPEFTYAHCFSPGLVGSNETVTYLFTMSKDPPVAPSQALDTGKLCSLL